MDKDLYKEDILTILGDPDGDRYSEKMISLALSRALMNYGQWRPQYRQLAVPVISCSKDSVRVELPKFADPAGIRAARRENSSVNLFRGIFHSPDGLMLKLYSGYRLKPGDMLQLSIRIPHTIEGLDQGSRTTVNEWDRLLIAEGAAGYAMLMRARSVSEVFGKRSDETERLFEEGSRMVDDFIRELSDGGFADVPFI